MAAPRPFGPDGQRPFGVADPVPVEGQVDDELERGRPAKGPGGAVDRDRAEDRDFDAVVGHAGERSSDRLRGGGGIRTLTGDGLSALPLPVGLRPRDTILDRVGHRRRMARWGISGRWPPIDEVLQVPQRPDAFSSETGAHLGLSEAVRLPGWTSGGTAPGRPAPRRAGAGSSRVSAPKIMVARSAGSQGRQSPMPSWLGSPVAAKASQAFCICRESVSTSGPPPEKTCTTGRCTAPKTNGSSSAWQEPRIPPKAGDSQSNR